jgi:hypothetical protein
MDAHEIERLYAQANHACRIAQETRDATAARQLRAREDAARVVEARLIREHDEALAVLHASSV